MADNRELVTIQLSPAEKLKIYGQLTAIMEKMGYDPEDWDKLELGIELPPNWPADKNDYPTMAQLVVLANKLKMKIVISNIDLFPQKEDAK